MRLSRSESSYASQMQGFQSYLLTLCDIRKPLALALHHSYWTRSDVCSQKLQLTQVSPLRAVSAFASHFPHLCLNVALELHLWMDRS